MSYAIEIKNISKYFTKPIRYRDIILKPFHHDRVPALQGINLQVEDGETIGLLGPNGAGKTTLIKIICNLILPTSGHILVKGLDSRQAEIKIRKIIGFVVSEERSFYWRLTGRQNLRFFAALNDLAGKSADKRIDELASVVGLESVLNKPVGDYSSGMKQKLAIARGLINNPEILFLDEPTKALDPVSADNFRQFITTLRKQGRCRTIVLATHNLEEAKIMSTRIVIIKNGRLVLSRTLSDLNKAFNMTQTFIVKAKGCAADFEIQLNANNGFFKIITVKNCEKDGNEAFATAEILSDDDPVTALKKLIHAGIDVVSFSPKEVSLNDLYKISIA